MFFQWIYLQSTYCNHSWSTTVTFQETSQEQQWTWPKGRDKPPVQMVKLFGSSHYPGHPQVFAPGIAASATKGEEMKPTSLRIEPSGCFSCWTWLVIFFGGLWPTTFGEFINHGEPFLWMFQSMEWAQRLYSSYVRSHQWCRDQPVIQHDKFFSALSM